MVSRRKILSRSRDELHSDIYFTHDEEDDVWHSKEKLYQDHVQEVMNKWESIDDEIWAKVIVLERNRRVAKAYARAPVLTVNGSDDGFDGFRIGVAGFDNPMRDATTDETIRQIGQGFKLKMDDIGNILIKRLSKGGVRVKNTTEESAVSNDILKLPGGLLEIDKPFKVFDMKKFQQNINRELKRSYPDRRKLESQCISGISFGSVDTDVLDCPIWIIVINIVAIEMLRSKMPPLPNSMLPPPNTRMVRPHSMESRIMLSNSGGVSGNPRPFGSGSSDEDPYSVAGSGSSGSSGGGGLNAGHGLLNRSRSRDKPPKLPPREPIYGPSLWAKPSNNNSNIEVKKEKTTGDDPYYCGLRARIPNFVKSRKKKVKESTNNNSSSAVTGIGSSGAVGKNRQLLNSDSNSAAQSLPPIPSHPFWWHTRLYESQNMALPPQLPSNTSYSKPSMFNNVLTGKMMKDDGSHDLRPMIIDSSDSDYSHIYGRLPIPTRGVRKFPTKPLFMSQWE